MFEILDSGLMTTVQDLGRRRYLSIASVKSGAMDTFSLYIGNLLVGNEPGDAGLEICVGLKIKALCQMVIAITGGDLLPKINNEDVPMWKTIRIEKGDVLSFTSIKSGFRAYLALSGAIDVPVLYGSKSTYVSGRHGDLGFGGFGGRVLRKGDIVRIGTPGKLIDSIEFRSLKSSVIPKFGDTWEIRVVLGPFDYFLTEQGLETFLNYPWKVWYGSSRTGYRYNGPILGFKDREKQKETGGHPSNYISDGVPLGAVQAPFGLPGILCADAFTVGGHAKIATVIDPDMDKVGQSKPGDKTFFKQVMIEEAQEIYKKAQELLREEIILY